MASKSEVGHNKNVANFKALYQLVSEMGALYNPTNETITLTAMEPYKGTLDSIIAKLNDKIPEYRNAVARRKTGNAPLDRKCTQALNSFKSLRVSDSDKENMSAIVKKIRGDKPKNINPETAEANAISTSQQSFDNKTANFGLFVSQLKSHVIYAPFEQDVTIGALEEYRDELNQLNADVNQVGYSLLTTRNQRNAKLYDDDINVMQMQRDIKAYLKSLGAAGDPYYKAAVKLKFRDI